MLRTLGFLFFASLSTAVSVQAEKLELLNGDRITGQIQTLKDGRLTVSTEWAAKLEIDFKLVVSITETEKRLVVEFVSGSRLMSKIRLEGGSLRLLDLPDSSVGRHEVLSMGPVPQAVRDPNPLQGWHGNTNLGFDFHRGNTDLSSLIWSFSPQRRTATDRVRASFLSRRTVEGGDTESDSHRGSIRYDRFIGPRFFAFGLVEAVRDGKEQLELRTREGGGIGLTWNPGDSQYSIFGGVTYTQEDYRNREYVHAAEGLLAFELQRKAFDGVVLTSKTQLLPRLSEGRYLAEFEAGLRLPVFGGVSFDLRLIDNFDSRPTAGAEKNDIGILSSVGYTF